LDPDEFDETACAVSDRPLLWMSYYRVLDSTENDRTLRHPKRLLVERPQ